VFEREKRGASVHRRKRERCVTVPVTGKGGGRGDEKALWRRAKQESAVMWEALWGKDHTPLDLLVTDKEEVCTPLRSYQVQVYTREEKIC
jgi:hypothetical protein